ncbi:hypothetical protein [Promicromonospora sukumoe]|uniref:Uncharacterized protein n=1 Tax=Promicromonospora sukumoe TaxID=88382 RepID=A0A7W3PEF0_9MICO|nr:hypothetical protein [Promicromonospora sukumoe]MBA8808691.1 hypothetical protein [Promicromonospora sukumoe]
MRSSAAHSARAGPDAPDAHPASGPCSAARARRTSGSATSSVLSSAASRPATRTSHGASPWNRTRSELCMATSVSR